MKLYILNEFRLCIFILLQDRLGNGYEMRSLEHCLNDIMKGVNDGGHHDFKGKPYYPRIEDHIAEESGGYDGLSLPLGSPARSSPQSQNSDMTERFSRKVFVGGLPPDIDEGN